ncbi:MAG TPA: alpha/beta fold hydrolase, partial [Thermoleophilaceae bacterium]|nr:alpha/beta fold hydrolase [Thermoleophilaceae bacterium]
MADTATPVREPHSSDPQEAEDAPSPAGAALDLLLTEAGLGARERFLPGRETLRLVTRLARRPGRVVRRSSALTGELAKVVAGRSELKPPRGDRRFLDPAWSASWIYRRLLQAYLAVDETLDGVIDDAELDWTDDHKLRFIAQNIVDALAPANAPLVNPEVLKGAIDTGGRNFVRGARQFARDVREPPRLPANVDVSKFAVGRDLGLSPGAVVLRDERFELIQYQPATPEVREVPILLVPPMINKYYVMDLAPGRSHIEYLVQRGQEVFAISWRNPRAEHRDWGLDAYANAVVEALEAVLDISGCDRAHILGYCAGGLVVAATISHLAAVGRLEQAASVTLGVCVIDNKHSNVVGALATEQVRNAAAAASAKKGYLDGRDLASVFLWLRPNDLIWPYVVNNWLLGKEPPTFDILYWNADTTRMPAALHRDFLEISTHNSMCRPGGVTVLGSPVDLGRITVDSYIVAGAADHISAWQNCYRTTQLLGGRTRFVLSTSGHIAAIVNPPGNKRATYRIADEQTPPDAAQWEELATTSQGTWWTDWDEWLAERSGG